MDLDAWLAKIKQARSHREVFSILDEFRKGEWADAQCSKMSKLYMRVLENLGPPDSDDLAAASAESTKSAGSGNTPVNDGPVWYEKM
ncbi:MAG TPA: hypothetical protein V6C97_16590 [Oculatellaceae cyanobacterium]